MPEIKRKPLTIFNLIQILKNTVNNGDAKMTDEVWMSSDEEGNSYSPVVFEGLALDPDNRRITLYPLFSEVPDYEELENA